MELGPTLLILELQYYETVQSIHLCKRRILPSGKRLPLLTDTAILDLPSIKVAERSKRLAEDGERHPEYAVSNHFLHGGVGLFKLSGESDEWELNHEAQECDPCG